MALHLPESYFHLIVNADLAAVLTLGDTQYETGTLSANSPNPTWESSITYPAVGNHEYSTFQAITATCCWQVKKLLKL